MVYQAQAAQKVVDPTGKEFRREGRRTSARSSLRYGAEVVPGFQILDEPRAGRRPAQGLAGERARSRHVQAEEGAHPAEVGGCIVGRDLDRTRFGGHSSKLPDVSGE